MDLQMPEMNGFEATEYIRNVMHSSIPIIALTADVTTVDLAKCKAVGMNDYIAKPVDEKILYNKIVSLVKKPALAQANLLSIEAPGIAAKCIDLEYLSQRTKSNPALMMEMIAVYLEQTPQLVQVMRQSLQTQDWEALYSAAHKILPSFSIMGIHTEFENMTKKVQEYAKTQQQMDEISELVFKIENICKQACKELLLELNQIKKLSNEG
jgi:CheY-like chemotaxis protein